MSRALASALLVGGVGTVGAIDVKVAFAADAGSRAPNEREAASDTAVPHIRGADSESRGRSGTAPTLSHAAIVSLANDRGLVCSGTLVAPNVVLTARHCLPIRTVRFGSDPARPNAVIEVTSAFTPPLSEVDVALVVLRRSAAVATLPFRRTAGGLSAGTFVRLVGYGATDPRGERGMGPIHRVDLPLRFYGCTRDDLDRYGCRPEFEMVLPRCGGSDTCAGDSGGPVLEETADGFRVVAVTSRAVASALLRCGDGGIYTRTEAIALWMDAVLKEVNGK